MWGVNINTYFATLYLSLQVICGKVREYAVSPWQIPLLFYSKAWGWSVCVCMCERERMTEGSDCSNPGCLSNGLSLEIYSKAGKIWMKKMNEEWCTLPQPSSQPDVLTALQVLTEEDCCCTWHLPWVNVEVYILYSNGMLVKLSVYALK